MIGSLLPKCSPPKATFGILFNGCMMSWISPNAPPICPHLRIDDHQSHTLDHHCHADTVQCMRNQHYEQNAIILTRPSVAQQGQHKMWINLEGSIFHYGGDGHHIIV